MKICTTNLLKLSKTRSVIVIDGLSFPGLQRKGGIYCCSVYRFVLFFFICWFSWVVIIIDGLSLPGLWRKGGIYCCSVYRFVLFFYLFAGSLEFFFNNRWIVPSRITTKRVICCSVSSSVFFVVAFRIWWFSCVFVVIDGLSFLELRRKGAIYCFSVYRFVLFFFYLLVVSSPFFPKSFDQTYEKAI